MLKIKYFNKKSVENIIYFVFLLIIIVNAFINNDYIPAVISAICGITYTALAGRGNPICYIFGLVGSFFYGYISYKNSLWGQLMLYMLYYVPMQISGFINWNKNLKTGKYEIVKTSLKKNEIVKIFLFSTFFIFVFYYFAKHFGDTCPVLDSITTILSITGMYLTVRRAIEQWILWMIVNGLSFILWFCIILSGEKVLSTVLMWGIYFFLAVYFYIDWKKELVLKSKNEL